MNIRDFVKTLDETRAEGYIVKLNVKGNLFEDILLFGAKKVVRHEFLLNSGTILFDEALVEEPRPMTRGEIVQLLSEGYFSHIVAEYDDDALGFASVTSRLDGTNQRRNFYGVHLVQGGLNKYGVFKATELLGENRSLNNFKTHVKQYTVNQGVLFIELGLTIKQTQDTTNKDVYIPLFNKPSLTIPAKGAIMTHGDLTIKLSTDVIVNQEVVKTPKGYLVEEQVYQVNNILLNIIIKIEPNKPVSGDYSYDYFLNQVQKLCKKQVETYEIDTNVNYKLIEVKFKDGDRVIELFGFLEELTGAIISLRYPTILKRQLDIVDIKYLTYDDVEEEEYQMMLELQKDLNKLGDSKLRTFNDYPQKLKQYFDQNIKHIAKQRGIHCQLSIMEKYTRNVRFKNYFSAENDMYIVYHQEMFLTLPTALKLESNKHLLSDVDEKVRKSFERIVREISEEYDDLVISTSTIKTVLKDEKYVSVFLLVWQYDKQFLTYDTDVSLPLMKVIDRLVQRFKTLQK